MSIFLQEGSAGKEGTNKQESGLEARFSDLLVTLALGKILVPSAYFFHKAQLPTSLDCENSSEIADMTVYTKKQDTLKLPSSLFPKTTSNLAGMLSYPRSFLMLTTKCAPHSSSQQTPDPYLLQPSTPEPLPPGSCWNPTHLPSTRLVAPSQL